MTEENSSNLLDPSTTGPSRNASLITGDSAGSGRLVALRKHGNSLILMQGDEDAAGIITDYAVMLVKERLQGKERYSALKNHRQPFRFWTNELFTRDHKKRLVTMFGFYDEIRKRLVAEGYQVQLFDSTPPPSNPDAYTPCWDCVADVAWRTNQREVLLLMASHQRAIIDAGAGFGKSFLIGQFCRLFNQARILITAKPLTTIRDTIYKDLTSLMIDVGYYGSHKRNHRVWCCSAGKLKNFREPVDIVIGDEIHQLAADDYVGPLARFQNARILGMTASLKREDGKHKRLEGIFGPVRKKITFQQAVAGGNVTQIRVIWRTVNSDKNPIENVGTYDDTERMRQAYWELDVRNRLIALDAESYDADVQRLIVTRTVQHVYELKKHLRDIGAEDWQVVIGEGLLHPNDKNRRRIEKQIDRMFERGLIDNIDQLREDADRSDDILAPFSRGEIKKVIVTSKWDQGVNLDQLQVLLRADGTTSFVAATQIPARTDRLFEGKFRGFVHDYDDCYSTWTQRRSRTRRGHYKSHDYEQVKGGPLNVRSLF